MKIIVIESIILCLLFSLMIFIFSRKPINTLYNYPPKIQERIKSLDRYKGQIPSNEKKLGTKLLAALLVVLVFSLILRYINGYKTFIEGLKYSYLLWTIINIYDALVMDVIWFCHDPYFVIEGSEDMVDEYHDYLFHIKQSLIGQLIALPVCILIGLVVSYIL